jgi:hypothetical protein
LPFLLALPSIPPRLFRQWYIPALPTRLHDLRLDIITTFDAEKGGREEVVERKEERREERISESGRAGLFLEESRMEWMRNREAMGDVVMRTVVARWRQHHPQSCLALSPFVKIRPFLAAFLSTPLRMSPPCLPNLSLTPHPPFSSSPSAAQRDQGHQGVPHHRQAKGCFVFGPTPLFPSQQL